MKYLILFFSLMCGIAEPLLHCDDKPIETIEYGDFDFDALDQAMIDSGMDQDMYIESPSDTIVFLRNLIDPLMVTLIVTCDYLRMKWASLLIIIKQKLNLIKKTKRYDTATIQT